MSDCNHEKDVRVQVIPAGAGYYAAYRVEGQDHAALASVVAWESRECVGCHEVSVYALVVKAYSERLVRAHAIEGFVGICAPDANADHKRIANKMLEQERAARTADAATRAARRARRTVTSVR